MLDLVVSCFKAHRIVSLVKIYMYIILGFQVNFTFVVPTLKIECALNNQDTAA